MKKLKDAALIIWTCFMCYIVSFSLPRDYKGSQVKNSGYRVEAEFLSDVSACNRRKASFQHAKIKYNGKIYESAVGCRSYKKGEKHYFIYSEKYDALASETHDYWSEIISEIFLFIFLVIYALVFYDRS